MKEKEAVTGTESEPPRLKEIVKKNVKTIAAIEKAAHDARTPVDKIADHIAAFCGSMHFVWVHCLWFGGWLLVNSLPMFKHSLRFDPPPFGILTLIVSLEAIFLSTFILISQNRQQKIADQRNQLDLQINLLDEQESSELIAMMAAIMEKLGVEIPNEKAMALKAETNAEKLAESIEQTMPETQ